VRVVNPEAPVVAPVIVPGAVVEPALVILIAVVGAAAEEEAVFLVDAVVDAEDVAHETVLLDQGSNVIVEAVDGTRHVAGREVFVEDGQSGRVDQGGRNDIARKRIALKAAVRRRPNGGGIVDLIFGPHCQQAREIPVPLRRCGHGVGSTTRRPGKRIADAFIAVHPEGPVPAAIEARDEDGPVGVGSPAVLPVIVLGQPGQVREKCVGIKRRVL
jgi:hypothetical protein